VTLKFGLKLGLKSGLKSVLRTLKLLTEMTGSANNLWLSLFHSPFSYQDYPITWLSWEVAATPPSKRLPLLVRGTVLGEGGAGRGVAAILWKVWRPFGPNCPK